MRKKREGKQGIGLQIGLYLAAVSVLLAFAGCEQPGDKEKKSVTVNQEALLTHDEKAMLEYLEGRTLGVASEEEYLNIAGLFAERKKAYYQRGVLEECVQVLGSSKAAEQLQNLWVNLEEEPELLSDARNMYQSMKSADQAEAVALLTDGKWLQRFAPKLYQVGRNYFLQEEGRLVLFFTVKYGEDGQLEATIWYPQGDDKITVLHGNAKEISALSCDRLGNEYGGAFERWTCISSSGDLIHEKGTLLKGMVVGNYVAQIAINVGAADISALWNQRDLFEYQEYSGIFDDAGNSLLRQLESVEGTLYAYNEDLGLGLYQEKKDEGFSMKKTAGTSIPAIKTYEKKEELA